MAIEKQITNTEKTLGDGSMTPSSNTQNNRYVVCDGWGHLFGAGMTESTVRFIYDKVDRVVVDMHIQTSLGWTQASKAQMIDVCESVHDNLDSASDKEVEDQLSEMVYDVVVSDELPVLGGDDEQNKNVLN